jgi:membrane protein
MSATTTADRPADVPSTTGTFTPKDFLKRLYKEFQADRVTGLAAQVAYSMVFAIPPLLVLLVTVAGLVDHTTGVGVTDSLHKVIAEQAPGDAKALLDRLVTDTIARVSGSSLSIGLIVSTLLAIWGGSGAIQAMIDAFNTAYEVEDGRKFLPKMVMRIGLTLAMIILIVLSFTLFMFGQSIGEWIASQVGLGSAFTTAWNILRWPAAAAIVLFLLALLYYFAPDIEQSFRFVSPGSAAAATLWVVSILGVKLYLKVADPGSAYGAAGSVIVLLFFFYVTGIVFILGAEINSILEKRFDPVAVRDLAEHPEKSTNPAAYQEAEQRAREMGEPVQPTGAQPTSRMPAHGAATDASTSAGRQGPITGSESRERRSFKGLAGMLAASLILERLRGGHKERT